MWRMEEHILDTPYMKKATTRKVRVYLPYTYDVNVEHYPVIYFHDGKAVFYGKTDFGTGSFEVLDTVTKMEQEQKIKGCIIVAIDNAREERSDEYLPFINSNQNGFQEGHYGGKAGDYADFVVNQLKPFIDTQYRTIPEQSSIIGSSMGGLVTAFIISKYPDVFEKAGILSIASWVYNEGEWLNYLQQSSPNKTMKYYIQVGTDEGHLPSDYTLAQRYIDDTLSYYQTLISLGVPVSNIKLRIGVGDKHSETTWSNYIEDFILYN